MKSKFSYRSDYFKPIILISLMLHLVGLAIGVNKVETRQVPVKNAPNTIAVSIIEEVVIEQEPVEKKIVDIKREVVETAELDVSDFEQTMTQEVEKNIVAVEKPVVKKPKLEAFKPVKPVEPKKIVEKKKIVKPVPEKKIEQQTIVSEASQGSITEAKPLEFENPAPLYPKRAIRRGWEGTVYLKVKVEKDGTPSEYHIHESSGKTILDEAALETIKLWRFQPAKSGDQLLATWITIPIEFKLVK